MKTIVAFIKIAIRITCFVLVVISVFIFLTVKTDVIPGIKSFTVLTGSMEPTIPVGSIVFMQKASNYQVNDVITFKRGDKMITHRIMQVTRNQDGTFYKTQGDANNAADSDLVNSKDVAGKGIFQIVYLGRLLFWVRTLPGFVVLVIAPTLIFVAMELWAIKNEIVKETERRIFEQLKANGLWRGERTSNLPQFLQES